MPQWPFYLDFTALQTAKYFERQTEKAEITLYCTGHITVLSILKICRIYSIHII